MHWSKVQGGGVRVLFTVGLVVGLVLGGCLLFFSRKAATSSDASVTAPVWPAYLSLALGIAAAGAFAAGVAGLTDTALAIMPVIALQFAAVLFGVGRLVFGDRRWQSWLGAGLATLPALFWVAFVIAEIVGPKH